MYQRKYIYQDINGDELVLVTTGTQYSDILETIDKSEEMLTRSVSVRTEILDEMLEPAVNIEIAEGKNIIEQIINDPDITDEQRRLYASLSDFAKRKVQATVGMIVDYEYYGNNSREFKINSNDSFCLTRALTQDSFTCAMRAMGIIGTGASGYVSVVKHMMKVTAKKAFVTALGGCVGLAFTTITIAIGVKDFYDCVRS